MINQFYIAITIYVGIIFSISIVIIIYFLIKIFVVNKNNKPEIISKFLQALTLNSAIAFFMFNFIKSFNNELLLNTLIINFIVFFTDIFKYFGILLILGLFIKFILYILKIFK